MSVPRFSIVIPTRGGADTLPATIRTCLDQDFDNFEIIVFDNDGPPEVKRAVDEVITPRVKYLRSGTLLPMSQNWESAVSHASGEYIMVLGNDDGLLGHALQEIDRLIVESGAKVIHADRVHYMWPSHPSRLDRDAICIPINRDLRIVESRTKIGEVLRFDAWHSDLPMIYHSMIHRSLLTTLQSSCGRKLFPAPNPDVYSGFAFAYLAGSYLSLDVPMVINGGSGNSNGAAHLLQSRTSQVAREYDQLNLNYHYDPHRLVPYLPYLREWAMGDSFMRAKEALFPQDEELSLDRKLLVERCLNGIRARDLEEWESALAAIRSSLEDAPVLLDWFNKLVPSAPRFEGPISQIFTWCRGVIGEQLVLDASRFGVRDVHDAARLCENILCFRRNGIRYDFTSRERCIQFLQSQVQDYRSQLDSLQLEIEAGDRETRQLHNDVSARQEAVEDYQQSNQVLRAYLSETEAKIRELDSRLRELQSRLTYRVARKAASAIKSIPVVGPLVARSAKGLLSRRAS